MREPRRDSAGGMRRASVGPHLTCNTACPTRLQAANGRDGQKCGRRTCAGAADASRGGVATMRGTQAPAAAGLFWTVTDFRRFAGRMRASGRGDGGRAKNGGAARSGTTGWWDVEGDIGGEVKDLGRARRGAGKRVRGMLT